MHKILKIVISNISYLIICFNKANKNDKKGGRKIETATPQGEAHRSFPVCSGFRRDQRIHRNGTGHGD